MGETKFIADLMGEDELGVVIRAHIHIEAQLVRLLEALVPYSEHLEKMDLDYAQKVQLTVAMGLAPEHVAPLNTLGSIRNRFAHKLESKLTKNDAENLYRVLGADDKDIVQESFERTKNQFAYDKLTKFKQLKPKEQFILIVVALRAMLRTAVTEAEKCANGTSQTKRYDMRRKP